jgi:peptidoglycan hydrolase-like protein with peptidoglycan-binding domain
MRSMSPVEIALVIAIGGSALAAGTPAFLRDLHASRSAEAIDSLADISARAVAFSEGRDLAGSFPPPSPLTPAEVPRRKPSVDPPGTWDTPTWTALQFGFTTAHSYAFAFDVASDPTRIWFQARAHGDLNGDGVTSTFLVEGERRPGQNAVVLPGLHIHREVE